MQKITYTDLERYKSWFASYVAGFNSTDLDKQRNFDLKRDHTLRVCDEIVHIGNELGLSEEELRVAETTALLHDVGRFEQYDRYGTFLDMKSINHAELGADIVHEQGILNDLDDDTQEIILKAIKYHNLPSLPEEETESCLFYTKLLRDADKLDIWRVVTDYYHRTRLEENSALEFGLPETPRISRQVYEDILNRKIVKIEHVKNRNDAKLLQMGWIFDINFRPTFKIVKERRYLELIRKVLPDTEQVDRVFSEVQSYLDEKLRNV